MERKSAADIAPASPRPPAKCINWVTLTGGGPPRRRPRRGKGPELGLGLPGRSDNATSHRQEKVLGRVMEKLTALLAQLSQIGSRRVYSRRYSRCTMLQGAHTNIKSD